MKTKTKKIEGTTSRGTKGFRFESNLEIGMRVKDGFGDEGEIVGAGIAGMPEVKYADGHTDCVMPHELEILS